MYKIIFEKKPLNFFRKLEKAIQERIAKKIDELKENPEIGVPLTGNLAGLWKLRIGDYLMIYKIIHNELVIFVLKLGHRKNVYD